MSAIAVYDIRGERPGGYGTIVSVHDSDDAATAAIASLAAGLSTDAIVDLMWIARLTLGAVGERVRVPSAMTADEEAAAYGDHLYEQQRDRDIEEAR